MRINKWRHPILWWQRRKETKLAIKMLNAITTEQMLEALDAIFNPDYDENKKEED